MSRRIMIETKMTDAVLLASALETLNTPFKQAGTVFTLNAERGRYGSYGVDTQTGNAFYDEDYIDNRTFVTHTLFQMYNKKLVLHNMLLEGQTVAEDYTARADTHIENFDDIIEEGDFVIRSFM